MINFDTFDINTIALWLSWVFETKVRTAFSVNVNAIVIVNIDIAIILIYNPDISVAR